MLLLHSRVADSLKCLRVLWSVILFLSPAVFAQTGASVSLAWEPSPGPGVVGYNVYCGTASGAYTRIEHFGDVTEARIEGLLTGITYFFAATAVASDGLESVFSNEVSYTVPAEEPDPYAVGIEQIAPQQDSRSLSVKVQWTPPVGEVSGYLVYSGTASGDYRTVTFVDEGGPQLVYSGLQANQRYFFAVAAIGPDGTVGPLSEEGTFFVSNDVQFSLNAAELSPTNLTGSVLLSVDYSPPGAMKHWLYYGRSPDSCTNFIELAASTSAFTVPNLEQGTTWYFGMSWESPDGTESELSRISSIELPRAWPLLEIRFPDEGGTLVRGVGPPGLEFQVLTSADRVNWLVVGVVAADSSGLMEYLDPRGPDGLKFYRLQLVD